MIRSIKVGSKTPWGRADFVKEIAPGIIQVSTPGHGGLFLTAERLAEMPAKFKIPNDFYKDGDQFFEEDCEWERVSKAFPQYFGQAL